MNHSEGYINVRDGKLFYQTFGNGEPIIVLHGGISIHHTYMLPSFLELASSYKLIFYDRRAVGKSLETPITSDYLNMQQFVDDLDDIYTFFNLSKATLLAHSWGTLLALEYAIKHPAKVSQMILLNPCPADYEGQKEYSTINNAHLAPLAEVMKPLSSFEAFSQLSGDEIGQLYRTLFSHQCYNPEDGKKLTLEFDQQSGQSGYKSMQALVQTEWMRPTINLFPDIKNLHIPTLVIHSSHDTIPVHTSQAIADALPDAELLLIEKCGHYPFVEKPKECFKAISEFLK